MSFSSHSDSLPWACPQFESLQQDLLCHLANALHLLYLNTLNTLNTLTCPTPELPGWEIGIPKAVWSRRSSQTRTWLASPVCLQPTKEKALENES